MANNSSKHRGPPKTSVSLAITSAGLKAGEAMLGTGPFHWGASAGGTAGLWAIFVNICPHPASPKIITSLTFPVPLTCLLPFPQEGWQACRSLKERESPVTGTRGPGLLRPGPPKRAPGGFDLSYSLWAKRPLVGHSFRTLIRPGPRITDANLFFFFHKGNTEMQWLKL